MKVLVLSAETPIRVAVGGDIDQAKLLAMEDPLSEAVGEDIYRNRVVIGMQQVERLDSTGVGWLLSCHKRFKQDGGSFVLHSLSVSATNVLRVLNMHLVFRIAENETEALAIIARDANGEGLKP